MSGNVSPHHPLFAGKVETGITASVMVDTGLRDVQAFSVTLLTLPAATAAFTYAVLDTTGETVKATIYIKTDAYADATTAVDLSWLALAK